MADHYLVTGGAGFIGSHICERLLEEGHTIRVLDDFSTGYRANVAPFLERYPEQFELQEGDIRKLDDCMRAAAGMRYVLHQAALASVPRSIEDPIATHHANATGTLNMLIAARDAGAERFVYAGSSSVYGNSKKSPKDETINPCPLSPYALCKYAGEEYGRLFRMHFGLQTVILRYFNVFGPRQDPDSPYAAVIPLFISALLRGQPPTIYGDGLQSRDFTFVTNIVDANLAACRSADAAGVYNVACGDRITVLELLDRVQAILGTSIAPVHEPPRGGDVRHSTADISRARRELGYEPRVGFTEGLAPTVAYFQGRPLEDSRQGSA
jgi:nucleoside-diphosphate-sugar epimerase